MMIEPALLVPLGVTGLAVGSFLNVVIMRVPAGESIIRPSSRCPRCESPIAPSDNVPVLSWLRLRGRCRSCGAPIPATYPAVELINALLWVAAGLRFGPHLMLAPYLALFSVLLALSAIDLERYILPNKITYPAIVGSLLAIPVVSVISGDPRSMLGALLGGGGYFLFLFLPAMLYPKGMGFGDVKLAALLGLYLGWIHPLLVLLSLVLASVLGLVAGVVVLLVRRGKNRPYPFGPWLALGCVLSILFSGPVLSIYGR